MKISKKDAIFKLLRACALTRIEPMTFLTAGKRERDLEKVGKESQFKDDIFILRVRYLTICL